MASDFRTARKSSSKKGELVMTRTKLFLSVWFLLICFAVSVSAQQAAPAVANAVVPPVIKFGSVLTDMNNKPVTGTVGVTFSLYNESQGGAPLWVETQNVSPDKTGHYTVMLGSTTSEGLPASLFASGEARWLGVQVQGQAEQPRTLLLSVPYALKALDAETIDGKPASAFMLAPQGGNSAAPGKLPPGTITGSGTADFVPMFTGTTTIGNSHIFQTVGGNVGVGTTSPAAKLDVKGTEDVRNTLTLYPSGTHPTLSVNGTALEVSNTGLVTFVSGQTFPGTGTVTKVGSGAGLTGGPITGSGTLSITSGGVTNAMLANPSLTVNAGTALTGGGAVSLGGSTTLNLDTTKVPLLAASNTFTGVNSFNGGLSATGPFNAVVGTTAGQGNVAVYGIETATSGGSLGVFGITSDGSGVGVLGSNQGSGYGVNGQSGSSLTACENCINNGYGVYGQSSGGYGVVGTVGSSAVDGVHGETSSENSGVAGLNFNSTSGYGVYGQAESASGIGGGFYNSDGGDALFTLSFGGGYAAFLDGNVEVDGNLSKAGGSFKIDHPLDPANKYLYHSFVESPDMMNIYNGVATIDAKGEAVIQMPEWFGVLNRDFRYQLTPIGAPGPNLYIAEEFVDGHFRIAGGKPGAKISWQITGIRQDAWANAHRIPVEEEKEARLKGFYIHPELYGAPPQKQIEWARHPEMMKKLQEHQQQMKEKQARPITPPTFEQHTRLIPPAALPHSNTK
jgi:trimeric autotransporter adhesin